MADWILNILEKFSYLGLAFLMWLENVFPPIPSELVIPLAGYHAHQGKLTFVGVVLAATLGATLGAWMFYFVARYIGQQRVEDWIDRRGRWVGLTAADLQKSRRWFDKHGAATVFFCRLVPGLRSAISIPAGLARQSLWQFTLYTVLGSLLWCLLLAFAGYQLGAQFESIGDYLNPVSWIVFGAALLWYLKRLIKPSEQQTTTGVNHGD